MEGGRGASVRYREPHMGPRISTDFHAGPSEIGCVCANAISSYAPVAPRPIVFTNTGLDPRPGPGFYSWCFKSQRDFFFPHHFYQLFIFSSYLLFVYTPLFFFFILSGFFLYQSILLYWNSIFNQMILQYGFRLGAWTVRKLVLHIQDVDEADREERIDGWQNEFYISLIARSTIPNLE